MKRQAVDAYLITQGMSIEHPVPPSATQLVTQSCRGVVLTLGDQFQQFTKFPSANLRVADRWFYYFSN